MLQHVDPFRGVAGAGSCLHGPSLPFGLVRLGPETLSPQPPNGYQSNQPMVRCSHTHLSGTGGMCRYGNSEIMPSTGHLRTELEAQERADERSAPGCYGVTLQPSGIAVDLSSSARVGTHRYTFLPGTDANLLLDAGCMIRLHWLGSERDPNGWPAECIGGALTLVSERDVDGRDDYRGGWGHHAPYSVFFALRSTQLIRQAWLADVGGIIANACQAKGPYLRAALSFGAVTTVEVEVGISFVRVTKARASIARAVGARDVVGVRAGAEQVWSAWLNLIAVEGGTETQRTLFYPLLARLLSMPNHLGIDDEFAQWHGGVRHFSDFSCLWDAVRNANSLLGLIDPALEVDLLRCRWDIGARTGWNPDAWIAGERAFLPGGSSADVLIAEASANNFPGLDLSAALTRMRKNNEVEPPDPYAQSRYLRAYRDCGFVSAEVPQSVSRHLENAYQDWCIAQIAARVGDPATTAAFTGSARKVWNLWRADLKRFAPRHADGRWVQPYAPRQCQDEAWTDPSCYEGTSVQWSFNVQHDVAALIQRHGGTSAFIVHLDDCFAGARTRPPQPDSPTHRHRDWYESKETMPHFLCLYLWAGRPDLTADAGPTQPYIVAATLAARSLTRAWLRHGEIAQGATLHPTLAAHPGTWGTTEPPPSPLSDGA